MYQIWDGFYAVAKLNGGRRSSATLTGDISNLDIDKTIDSDLADS